MRAVPVLKPADLEIGRTYWMRMAPGNLRADTWTPYVVVGIDITTRPPLILYKQHGGEEIYKLYWENFRLHAVTGYSAISTTSPS